MPNNIHRILILTLLLPTTFAAKPITPFEACEHVAIGDSVKLKFPTNENGQANYHFHLPGNIDISYGDITAIGDFYGTVGAPISHGNNESDDRERFLSAFNSFAQNQSAANEMKQLLTIIHTERSAINAGMQAGQSPEDIFKRIDDDYNRQYNCVTGGGCSSTGWWLNAGRYLDLASENYDHFGENAWLTYKTGHQLALDTAIEGYQFHDEHLLERAYSIDAFACHFLMDRFAAGHIRTPREGLPKHTTPDVVGSMLVIFMHDEENHFGIHVHNRRGDHWVTYGDRIYFDKKFDHARSILQEAMQLSANQIYTAFKTGIAPSNDAVHELIPEADESGYAAQHDISPLFFWDENAHEMMRRSDTANEYDRHWTADWWGWSTFILLRDQKGLSTMAQINLIRAGYGEQALQYGLISNPDLITYLKAARKR